VVRGKWLVVSGSGVGVVWAEVEQGRVAQRTQRNSTKSTERAVTLSAQLFLALRVENDCRCKGTTGLGAILTVSLCAQKCTISAQLRK
jgi:hypothetical protein